MAGSLGRRPGEKVEYAGPGAPHGAWPLVAAYFGTRGCRGPTYSEVPPYDAEPVTQGIPLAFR